jgi:arginyl-tRNA synthetase
VELIKDKIAHALEQALAAAIQNEVIPPLPPQDVEVGHTEESSFGDYASTLPFRLAKLTQMSPQGSAEAILPFIPEISEVEKIEVARPGFINFTLKDTWLKTQVEKILKESERYGDLDVGKGKRIQIEFVSVNPTGPLHVGHGRGAVIGSTLAWVLSRCGFEVHREYYVNDAGAQMESFFQSLLSYYRGRPSEAISYRGSYMEDLAEEIGRELPAGSGVEEPTILKLGASKILDGIRRDLALLGVEFDNFFSEKSLYEEGDYQEVMSYLKKRGCTIKKEGALWFVFREEDGDRESVLVRQNGFPTYFASDVAYHWNKFYGRRFNEVIDIWGADHQGHVSRMKAVMKALDIDPQRLKIIICQMVTLKKRGEEVKLSKRGGDIVSLRELIDEVGRDAVRFFFLSRASQSQMEFDLELAKKRSEDNPVYYIQYAHARICSILRLARERGVGGEGGDVGLLSAPAELSLLRKMVELPELMLRVEESLEPHHLSYFATDLATLFHIFYRDCRVISEDEELTRARLKLVSAVKIILTKVLDLMGISAPEQM